MANKHTKQSIIELLQALATNLKTSSLSKKFVAPHIPISTISYHFGSFSKAIESAGLTTTFDPSSPPTKNSLSDDALFRSLLDLETNIQHEPTFNDNTAHGKFSQKPFKRFGKWEDTLNFYRKWKTDNNITTTTHEAEKSTAATQSQIIRSRHNNVIKKPQQFYGEPIDFRGLRNAPINEQGVVYLFGMISRELGFYIESIQQGFPDCEGKYLYDKSKNLWAKARIEFEYKSSNFVEHCHDVDGCDFIVCWIDDWKDCPINVIELQSEIMKLPSK